MKAPESKKAPKSKIIFAVASVLFMLTLFTCTELVGLPPKPEFTVTYDLAGGTGAPPVDDTVYPRYASVFVQSPEGANKDGYAFRGWMLDSSNFRYNPGDLVQIKKNFAFKAYWEPFYASDITEFNVKKVTDGSWYKIKATKLYENAVCVVYADINDCLTTRPQAQALADTYKDHMSSQFLTTFGNHNDSAITLLMTDLIDGYRGSGDYTGAVFDKTHMEGGTHSNNHDMIFVDTMPGLKFFDETCASMAREMCRLILWSRTQGRPDPNPEKEAWIQEGLAIAAERLFLAEKTGNQDYQIQSHIDYYNNSFNSYTRKALNSIANGNTFFVWNGPEGDLRADRATAYLFFEWLRLHQNSSGIHIFRRIIEPPYDDATAVVGAAQSKIPELELALAGNNAQKWTKLYGSWLAANMVNHASSIYGYKGKITLNPIVYTSFSSESRSLLPGEFVQSQFYQGNANANRAVTQGNGSSNHIYYIGVTNDYASADASFPGTINGRYAISFNANTAINGNAEAGNVLEMQ